MTTARSRARQPRNAVHSYERLEHRLTLLSWLHDRLGFENTKALLDQTKKAREGFDADGRSDVCRILTSREGPKVSDDDLRRYDGNIREHLSAMNAGRSQPITLRYFQYLAALYTEIFLDRYDRSPAALMKSLNAHVDKLNASNLGVRAEQYEESDLRKLAFWMATGSGKTLLMHLNYRQYLRYNREPLDNILLITPSEDLTRQHLEELQTSGIPARRFDLSESGLFGAEARTIRVIDIHKLVTNKQGKGVSVPVEAFEGRNLVFVDEGHKGSSSEARTWRSMRAALVADGFTFEYSATFGQALNAAGDDTLVEEYGKAIAFDYSYHYFYDDGYGKDFRILNLQRETTGERTQTLLLGNLLSFYEQQLVFADRGEDLRPYNLERPLWIFVGSSVNAVRTERGRPRSDVLTVARFLHRTLSETAWATETIGRLLEGESDLRDEHKVDLFADKYPYLRARGRSDAAAVYQDVLERTLHAPSSGGLHIVDIKGSDGELGLKAAGSDTYFGLIYIGDTAKFKSLVAEDGAGITVEEDRIAGSLFDDIGTPGTTMEVLIGSKKFIEGWNSWRVSNMGLLNIGKSEGSQIVQLFGRGVRLRGRGMTLKRSSAVEARHPEHIELLETLNIFAIRANYMAQFKDYLQREGVPTEGRLELPLFIRPNREFLDKGLVVPRVDEGRDFKTEAEVVLEYAEGVGPVSIDVSAKVQSLDSGGSGVDESSASSGQKTVISDDSLAIVDWDKAYLSLIEHKERRGMDNLMILPAALKPIMEAGKKAYLLVAEESLTEPTSAEEWGRLQDTVAGILRLYADRLYRRSRERWESAHMVYKTLDETDANFRFNKIREGSRGRYIVGVESSKQELIAEIEALIDDCRALYESDDDNLPRIYFDHHLYQPLLVEKDGTPLKMSPPGLTESEQRFVDDLKQYWDKKKRVDGPDDAEVFLLRNQSRGAGVGFFEESGFYPDFILWVKSVGAQRVVFVEPHGMRQENAPEHSDKIGLYKRLRELGATMRERSAFDDVTLDSFIVSETPYEALSKRWRGNWSRSDFATEHILFPERKGEYDYVAEIVEGRVASPAKAPAASI